VFGARWRHPRRSVTQDRKGGYENEANGDARLQKRGMASANAAREIHHEGLRLPQRFLSPSLRLRLRAATGECFSTAVDQAVVRLLWDSKIQRFCTVPGMVLRIPAPALHTIRDPHFHPDGFLLVAHGRTTRQRREQVPILQHLSQRMGLSRKEPHHKDAHAEQQDGCRAVLHNLKRASRNESPKKTYLQRHRETPDELLKWLKDESPDNNQRDEDCAVPGELVHAGVALYQ